MASRELSDLTPTMARTAMTVINQFDERAPVGVSLLIYCTYRRPEQQARRFRQGRTLAMIEARAVQLERKYSRPDLAEILRNAEPQRGKRRVTNAGPGQSIHQYRGAFDGARLRDGDIVWGARAAEDAALWALYGQVVEAEGLVWGGNWRRRDMPHAQQGDVSWRELIRAGAR